MNQVQQLRNLITKLYEIKRSGMIGAMRDLADVLEYDLESASLELDEIELHLHPDYPDQQLILKHEIEKLAVV